MGTFTEYVVVSTFPTNPFVESQEECRVILAEAMISEVEHQANEGRSIGFAALDELKKLRQLERDGKIFIEVFGRRPQEWQMKRGKAGEIDEIIRSVALENDAILVTGDRIQKDIAVIKGIKVEYLEPLPAFHWAPSQNMWL